MIGESQRLITVDEFCKILRIGRNTAYDLLKSGYIQGVWKIGRVWKIPRQAVENYINSNGLSQSDDIYTLFQE